MDIIYEMYKETHGAQVTLARFNEIRKHDGTLSDEDMGTAWFAMYSEALGGKLSKESYLIIQKAFVELTSDAFIGGEGSTVEAMNKFSAWLRERYPKESATRLFESVDFVTAYT